MAKPFTQKYIDSLKAKDTQYRVYEARGFCVRVLPSGTKSFAYRFTIGGRKQELGLGTYPEVTLAAAREKYQAAYTKLKNSIDPRHVEPTGELATFKHFSDLYLTEYSKAHHSASWQKTIRLSLENDVLPYWSDKDIKDIKRADGIDLVERVIKREKPGQAANVYKAAMGVLGYALERGHLEYNVLTGLSKPVKALRPKSRRRVLTEEEIKHVWNALKDSSIGRALKLILVTAQRPGEVAGLHTQEMQAGEGRPFCKTCRGCKNLWTIPQERAEKGEGNHIVYLTTTAVNLTRSTEDVDGLVFDVKRNSLSQYLSRDKNYLDLPRWTPHDLRRTARTLMAKIGIINEHAEAVIAHKKPGIVADYNQWDYKEEKEQALIKWEAELLRIVT
jgi:integrase